MEVRITARHFTLNQPQKTAIEQRVLKLSQYYDGITDTQVILDRVSDAANGMLAELNVNVFRQTLFANSDGESVEKAVDAAAERMRRQLIRYKAKLRSKDKDFIR